MCDLLTRGTADGTAPHYSSRVTWGIADVATHHVEMPMYAELRPTAWTRLNESQQR